MRFDFTCYTDEQIEQKRNGHILPAGEYDAIVTDMKDQFSRGGNPMAVLYLEVWGKEGQKVEVIDYLPDMDSMAWKIKHFCESIGLLYEKESIYSNEVIGKTVLVLLAFEKAKPYQDKNGNMQPGKDKNVIKDYLPQQEATTKEHAEPKKDDMEDDIPF